jgi:hypothetical protein
MVDRINTMPGFATRAEVIEAALVKAYRLKLPL